MADKVWANVEPQMDHTTPDSRAHIFSPLFLNCPLNMKLLKLPWILFFFFSCLFFDEGINEIANVANVPTDGDGRMTS